MLLIPILHARMQEFHDCSRSQPQTFWRSDSHSTHYICSPSSARKSFGIYYLIRRWESEIPLARHAVAGVWWGRSPPDAEDQGHS